MQLARPIVSFVCAVLSLFPLPWHIRAGTMPTISIALWLFVSNIINGVNTIIWAGNVNIIAPVWCDISTKINVGSNLALPASIFCLCINLERASSVRQASTDHSQRRRRRIVDAFFCFGIPMIYMTLHYIVQGHRFDIIEDLGCRPNFYESIASIFLIWLPPILFSLGTFVLSALSFRNFWLRRVTFARHLQTTSALTPSRYFRLMAMSLFLMTWGLAVTIFLMWFSLSPGLRPWISWEDVHSNFSRIGLFPRLLIPRKTLLYTYLLWWTMPVSTVIFFAFFAFGQEAMKEYCGCFIWVKRTVFRRQDAENLKPGKLPSYNSETHRINLSPLGKAFNKHSYSKSEMTIAAPSSPYKAYQPSTLSHSAYASSMTTEVLNPQIKNGDAESLDSRS